MITPEQAGIKDNTKDVEHAKFRLEVYIDEQLSSIVMVGDMIIFSLADKRNSYRSSQPGEIPKYNFYDEVLLPVIEKYKNAGWFVYCRTFFSLIQRDHLYFSQKPQELAKGFILEWEGEPFKMKPVRAIENKSDFFIPGYKTLAEAEEMIKNY